MQGRDTRSSAPIPSKKLDRPRDQWFRREIQMFSPLPQNLLEMFSQSMMYRVVSLGFPEKKDK